MANTKWVLLKEARKLRSKAFRKKVEMERLEKQADELEKEAIKNQ